MWAQTTWCLTTNTDSDSVGLGWDLDCAFLTLLARDANAVVHGSYFGSHFLSPPMSSSISLASSGQFTYLSLLAISEHFEGVAYALLSFVSPVIMLGSQ